jgi:hypothetical protein
MKKIVFLFILFLLVTNEADSYLNIHSKKLLSAYHERQLSTPVLSNTLLIRYKQDYYYSKNKSNSIHRWINDNEDLKVGLANSITSFIPFTRETIMFSIVHNSLSIDESGSIDIKPRRSKFNSNDEEINNCLKKAEVIGKVFSRSGNPLTIYSILGIKP